MRCTPPLSLSLFSLFSLFSFMWLFLSQVGHTTPLTPLTLDELAEVWLEEAARPSPKSPSSPPPLSAHTLNISLKGAAAEFGAQEGVISAPLHSLSLQRALFAKVSSQTLPLVHSLSLAPLSKRLGFQLFDPQSSPSTSGRFMHISQEAARWLGRLTRGEHGGALGHSISALLTTLYPAQLKQLAAAHIYLVQQDLLPFERAAYEIAMEEMFFQGPAYLKSRFDHVNTGYATPQSPDHVALGFWLRREIDGTRPLLWEALKPLIHRLDPQLLDQLTQVSHPEPPRRTFDAPLSSSELALLYEEALKTPHKANSSALFWLPQAFKGGALIKEALQGSLPYPLLTPREAEEKGERPFSFYHPRFIMWATDQLIPPAELTVGGKSVKGLYKAHLKVTIESLIRARRFLDERADISAERFEFVMAIASKKDPTAQLKDRFKGQLEHLKTAPLIQPEESLAFWLRREIDGSAPILWGALRVLLHRLDPQRAEALREQL